MPFLQLHARPCHMPRAPMLWVMQQRLFSPACRLDASGSLGQGWCGAPCLCASVLEGQLPSHLRHHSHPPSFIHINARSTSLTFVLAFAAASCGLFTQTPIDPLHLHVGVHTAFPHLCTTMPKGTSVMSVSQVTHVFSRPRQCPNHAPSICIEFPSAFTAHPPHRLCATTRTPKWLRFLHLRQCSHLRTLNLPRVHVVV
jgi:hypothetical protein